MSCEKIELAIQKIEDVADKKSKVLFKAGFQGIPVLFELKEIIEILNSVKQ